MDLSQDFETVIDIPMGHIRHGMYLVKSDENEEEFYWTLTESPNKLPVGMRTYDKVSDLKKKVAIRIYDSSQLRAIANKMLRDADAMEKYLKGEDYDG